MDIRYAAGFFDGEGCISIRRTGMCRADITNTDRAILQKFQAHFGGTVRRKLTRTLPNRRPQWQWDIGVQSGLHGFLRLILPHLKLKRPQAELMLQALEVVPGARGKQYMAMGELNKRGVKPVARKFNAARELNRQGLRAGPRAKFRSGGTRVLARSR